MQRYWTRTVVLVVLALAMCAAARSAGAATLDLTGAPGSNYDKANFRLWIPDGAGPLRAVVVLVPGSNGDGRPQADDEFWQTFATRNKLALVGCQFTDKTHDQMFIEHYVDVSKGSGQALIDALATFASRANHPELASAPLLLWGMSAGGEFNYEFVAWKPERVVAFIVNKGNVYYTALASQAARSVPGILFTGEKDLEFRVSTIVGLFAVNRRAGALWAYAEEPGIGHAVGRSRDMAVMLYEDMLAARLPEAGSQSSTLRPVSENAGFYGDMKTKTFEPVKDAKAPAYPVAWLPTERLARAWQAVIAGKPFDR
jgi:poly(3-hydroxybutyrate) depolymerase